MCVCEREEERVCVIESMGVRECVCEREWKSVCVRGRV